MQSKKTPAIKKRRDFDGNIPLVQGAVKEEGEL